MTLNQIINTFSLDTDKLELGYIDEFYEKLFHPIKHDVENVLEIGIYRGDSILLWKEYFQNATIFGMDINIVEKLFPHKRVHQIRCDAYTEDAQNKLSENYFDIIIDDGTHEKNAQTYFVKEYFKFVKPGGLMILEDIINPDLTPQLIDMVDKNKAIVKVYDMRNKQKNNELLSRWKNGLDVLVIKKLKD